MDDLLPKIGEALKKADLAKRKGDALHRAGRTDAAQQSWSEGRGYLTEILEMAEPERQRLLTTDPPLPADSNKLVQDLIEAFGSRGGFHQRLNLLEEARKDYSCGGTLEKRFVVPSTYNRMNEIKYIILTGASLESAQKRLAELSMDIQEKLEADAEWKDRGWIWADLGDSLALQGRLTEAEQAYSTFIAKAETRSPVRTLDVLREIANHLEQTKDPGAPRLRSALDILKNRLTS